MDWTWYVNFLNYVWLSYLHADPSWWASVDIGEIRSEWASCFNLRAQVWIISCIQHADIHNRAYLCQVSDTRSPEPLVFRQFLKNDSLFEIICLIGIVSYLANIKYQVICQLNQTWRSRKASKVRLLTKCQWLVDMFTLFYPSLHVHWKEPFPCIMYVQMRSIYISLFYI